MCPFLSNPRSNFPKPRSYARKPRARCNSTTCLCLLVPSLQLPFVRLFFSSPFLYFENAYVSVFLVHPGTAWARRMVSFHDINLRVWLLFGEKDLLGKIPPFECYSLERLPSPGRQPLGNFRYQLFLSMQSLSSAGLESPLYTKADWTSSYSPTFHNSKEAVRRRARRRRRHRRVRRLRRRRRMARRQHQARGLPAPAPTPPPVPAPARPPPPRSPPPPYSPPRCPPPPEEPSPLDQTSSSAGPPLPGPFAIVTPPCSPPPAYGEGESEDDDLPLYLTDDSEAAVPPADTTRSRPPSERRRLARGSEREAAASQRAKVERDQSARGGGLETKHHR